MKEKRNIFKINKKKEQFNNVEDVSEEKKPRNPNRELLLITYIFVGLFAALMMNFSYFIFMQSSEVINNSYNKRQDLLAKRVVRGDILSSNGEVLATTEENKNGSKRIYPYKDLFSHSVGKFLKGKTGIEQNENFRLLTSHDNPITTVMNELAGEKNIGDRVVSTLDLNLQKIAHDSLGNRKGSVVVMEPKTGKILAMVSKPDFDPNKIEENWDELIKDEEENSTLINRATQGLYPPGSTFKILTALEYIRENPKYNKKIIFECTGKTIINNVEINCYNNKKHGKQTLEQAFANSCNGAFAYIGTKINMDSFSGLCTKFLFNTKLPSDMPYNQSSFILNAKSPKEEIPQTVIGQGKTLVTPFHNLLITSAIANGGILMRPYFVDRIENHNGILVKKNVPKTYSTIIQSNEAAQITKLMESVVTDGTAYKLKNMGVSVAGKTGSAEFDSGKSSHAWFVGFAPADNPEIAVSIIIEGVGTGSDYAVPVAKDIFTSYFKK